MLGKKKNQNIKNKIDNKTYEYANNYSFMNLVADRPTYPTNLFENFYILLDLDFHLYTTLNFYIAKFINLWK